MHGMSYAITVNHQVAKVSSHLLCLACPP